MYHGEHKTDFEHPGCGGMFYEKAHKMRFSMVSLNHDFISWMAASLSLILRIRSFGSYD